MTKINLGNFKSNDAWTAWTKYKYLEDKIKDLKRQAWQDFPGDMSVEVSLGEAEEELARLKAWIEMTYQTKRID